MSRLLHCRPLRALGAAAVTRLKGELRDGLSVSVSSRQLLNRIDLRVVLRTIPRAHDFISRAAHRALPLPVRAVTASQLASAVSPQFHVPCSLLHPMHRLPTTTTRWTISTTSTTIRARRSSRLRRGRRLLLVEEARLGRRVSACCLMIVVLLRRFAAMPVAVCIHSVCAQSSPVLGPLIVGPSLQAFPPAWAPAPIPASPRPSSACSWRGREAPVRR
jgi:hypothetical protein